MSKIKNIMNHFLGMNLIEKSILCIIFILFFNIVLRNIIFLEIHSFSEYTTWLSMRIMALLTGLFLYICIVFIFLKYSYRDISGKFNFKISDFFILLFFIIYGLFSTINGFLRQNDIIYIVGDVFQLFIFAFLYFFSAIFVQSKNIKKIINFSVYFIFILMCLELAYAFYRYFDLGYFRKTAGYLFILPFIYFFIKYIKCRSLGKNNKKLFIFLLISIFIIFLTISVALIITMFLLMFLYTFLLKFYKKKYLNFVLTIFFIIALFFLLELFNVFPVLERISLSAFLTEGGKESVYSHSYRVGEVLSIFNTMSGNYFNYLVGMGQGAFRVLSQESTYTNVRPGDLHTIHFTPGSVFFRMGFIGLAIFVLFLLSTLLFLYNKYKKIDCSQQSNKFYLEVIFFFFIACIILSIRGYGIINAPILAILLGLARNKNFI